MRRAILAGLGLAFFLGACAEEPTAPVNDLQPSFSEAPPPNTTCPDDGLFYIQAPADQVDGGEAVDDPANGGNGNGWVCAAFTFGGIVVVDDIIVGEPTGLTLTAGKVNGHANYEVANEKLSFSFHAESDGETIEGNFEFHNRTTKARYHGDVTCMELDGAGNAVMQGIITNSKKGELEEGDIVGWVAEDNGEGKKDPADQVSGLEVAPELPPLGPCGFRTTGVPTDISGGNIQVR